MSHDQGPTAYIPHEDPYAAHYAQPSQYNQPIFNPETYNSISLVTHSPPLMPLPGTNTGYYPPMSTSPPMHHPQPDRTYTLGGDGYGSNQLPSLPEETHAAEANSPPLPSLPPASLQAGYHAYGPGPIDTGVGGYSGQQSLQASPVKGPRPQPGFDDAPPGYEPSSTGATGHWGKR
jgi:hypothetical protein